jgi:endo-1,4-beta-xylanase
MVGGAAWAQTSGAGRPAPGEEWKAMEGDGYFQPNAASLDAVVRARASIERIRKRDVEILVVDAAGKALPKVPVQVIQKRQAFPFGDQLWELDTLVRFHEQEGDRARYVKQLFTGVLSAATALCYWTERPRNDSSKAEDFQGESRLENFAYCVDWAKTAGLTVKGHPLFWSIPKAVPDWVKQYEYPTQMKFLEVRVRNLVARFRGKVSIWDAVNESLWEPAFRNLPSRAWPHLEAIPAIADYVEPVIRWAREEDPDACYVLNDYGLEQDDPQHVPVARDGTRVTARLQRKRMLELLKVLCDRGAAPGAIGLQSHTGGWLDPVEQVRVYDELAASGLPIHVTEFGADGASRPGMSKEDADKALGDYVVNAMTCAFGHPAVEAFFFWGMGGVLWRERSSNEAQPLYYRLRDLLRKEWMTQAALVTGEDGRICFRGFFGDYVLRFPVSPNMQQGVRFTVAREDRMPLTLTAPFMKRT